MAIIGLKLPAISMLTLTFAFAYVVILAWFVPKFMILDANVIAGCILAPFICTLNQQKRSWRFLFPAILTMLIALKLPVNSLFFIATMFTIALLIENSIGKISKSALFLIVLISPVFKYALAMVDFPMRLWLTDKVVILLNNMGTPALAEGNVIVMGKFEFAVDPACAGLNMLIISLIISLFLTAYLQKQSKKQLSGMVTAGVALLTIILNVGSNYFRILLLVLFKIMPDTFFHDFVGIVCLLIYVILPLMMGLKPLIDNFGKELKNTGAANQESLYAVRYYFVHATMLVTLIFIATHMTTGDELAIKNLTISIPGFRKKQLDGGIIKFENEKALIYLKPAAYYIPGHDPKICWTGSGYLFKNIRKEKIGGFEIYTAVLQKKKDLIYAAWWFDSDQLKTVDQITWRWKSLSERRIFYLVNVNASRKAELRNQVIKMLRLKNDYRIVSN
jgi:exosortase N